MQENWKIYYLNEIAEILNSKRIPLNSRERSKKKGSIPYYGASGIVDYIDDYLFEGEHVLVSEDGENLRSRNTPIAFKADGKFWVNNHAHILRGKKRFLNDWIVYYFACLNINPYVSGAVQPKLNKQALLSIPVLTPDFSEVNAITAILRSLDDKIELNLQINTTLEDMAMALYKHWFVDFGPFQNEKFITSELGEIPEGWKILELKEVTKELRRGISPKYTEEDGVQVINQRCIRNHIINFSLTRRNDSSKRKVDGRLIEKGDVLINSTGVGTLGRIAPVLEIKEETVADSHVTVVRPNIEIFKIHTFARLMLNMEPLIEAMGHGSTGQTELSRSELGKLKILVPPFQKQEQLENQLKYFSETVLNNINSNETLTKLRDTLLPKLISGEVRVKQAEKILTEAL